MFRSGSESPPRPPISPITPVTSHAHLPHPPPSTQRIIPPSIYSHNTFQHPQHVPSAIAIGPAPHSPSTFAAQPEPVPISLSDNTDAIALRSAISLLQMQRARSRRDIHTLERIKQAALAQPEVFAREVKAGRLYSGAGTMRERESGADEEDDEEHSGADRSTSRSGDGTDAMDVLSATLPTTAPAADADMNDDTLSFPPVPRPQTVFRCPPINWAKYHVVGEALDALHAEQTTRPSNGVEATESATRAPLHVLAAPYSPFTDRDGGGVGVGGTRAGTGGGANGGLGLNGGEQRQGVTKKGSKKPN